MTQTRELDKIYLKYFTKYKQKWRISSYTETNHIVQSY